jgi:hypothetical protein
MCPECMEHVKIIEDIIIDNITGWGKHFGVDTSCVNKDRQHPIWQQIYGLLTSLYLDIEDLRDKVQELKDKNEN